MKTTVGTNNWALRSDGWLRRRDYARLTAQAMLTQLAAMPRHMRKTLSLDESALPRIDLDKIRVPDSDVAMRAESLIRSSSAAWLANHCMRTYLWGAILGQSGGMRFDEELLFVASALHDLGLTEEHRCKVHGAACFAVKGARAADEFAKHCGWTTERRDRLSEAISLHLNVRVGLEHGMEAHLLHEGAALDLIGVRARDIQRDTIRAVFMMYPPCDLKEGIVAAMKDETRANPRTRAAFLTNTGLIRMIHSVWRERYSSGMT